MQRSFGDQFSQSIQNLSVKKWSGPISSEYGEHLIFINSYSDSYLPDLSKIKELVVSDILVRDQSQSTENYLKVVEKKELVKIH